MSLSALRASAGMFSAWFLRPAVFQEWYCFFDSCNWRTLTVEVQKVSCWQYPCLFFCCLLVNQWFKIFFLSMQSFLFRVFPSLFLLIDYFLQVSSENLSRMLSNRAMMLLCLVASSAPVASFFRLSWHMAFFLDFFVCFTIDIWSCLFLMPWFCSC